MKFSEEIRKFIESLPPTVRLSETQIWNYVYAAHGEIDTGMCVHPVTIRIKRTDGGMTVRVRSKKSSMGVDIPFGSEKDRDDAPGQVRTIVLRHWN